MHVLEALKRHVIMPLLRGKHCSGYLVPSIFGGLLLVLLSRYSLLTERYLYVWKDGLSLWQYTSQQVPQIPVVQIQLANSYHTQGEHAWAVAIIKQAIKNTNPDELDRQRMEHKVRERERLK
jgi:protein O-mannosyl-transferase